MTVQQARDARDDTPFTILIIFSPDATAYAEAVRARFQDLGFTVDLGESLVDINDQSLETLLNWAAYHDFSIAVLGPDSGAAQSNDNTYFEFGLLVGRLGPHRAFPIVEQSVQLFRDWQDISVARYDGTAAPASAISAACSEIAEQMRNASSRETLTMLPSTALAIGYYTNFLDRVVTALSSGTQAVELLGPEGSTERVIDPRVDDIKIDVRVPRDLRDLEPPILSQLTAEYRRVVVSTPVRPFPLYIESGLNTATDPVRLIDLPTTLVSAYHAHEEMFGSDFLGGPDSAVRRRLQDREIQNFENTLRQLLPDPQENMFFRFTVTE